MSQQKNELVLSFKNSADLSAKQYYFVGISADQSVNVSGASAKPVGVLIEPNKSGYTNVPVGVCVLGTAKIVVKKNADEALPAAGDYIVSASDGKGMKLKSETVDLNRGIALESASAEGDIIEILLV